MAMYAGFKDDGVTPLLHITSDDRSESELKGGTLPTTLFNSDLPYIYTIHKEQCTTLRKFQISSDTHFYGFDISAHAQNLINQGYLWTATRIYTSRRKETNKLDLVNSDDLMSAPPSRVATCGLNTVQGNTGNFAGPWPDSGAIPPPFARTNGYIVELPSSSGVWSASANANQWQYNTSQYASTTGIFDFSPTINQVIGFGGSQSVSSPLPTVINSDRWATGGYKGNSFPYFVYPGELKLYIYNIRVNSDGTITIPDPNAGGQGIFVDNTTIQVGSTTDFRINDVAFVTRIPQQGSIVSRTGGYYTNDAGSGQPWSTNMVEPASYYVGYLGQNIFNITNIFDNGQLINWAYAAAPHMDALEVQMDRFGTNNKAIDGDPAPFGVIDPSKFDGGVRGIQITEDSINIEGNGGRILPLVQPAGTLLSCAEATQFVFPTITDITFADIKYNPNTTYTPIGGNPVEQDEHGVYELVVDVGTVPFPQNIPGTNEIGYQVANINHVGFARNYNVVTGLVAQANITASASTGGMISPTYMQSSEAYPWFDVFSAVSNSTRNLHRGQYGATYPSENQYQAVGIFYRVYVDFAARVFRLRVVYNGYNAYTKVVKTIEYFNWVNKMGETEVRYSAPQVTASILFFYAQRAAAGLYNTNIPNRP